MSQAELLGPGMCDECEVTVEARKVVPIGAKRLKLCYKCQTGFLGGKKPRSQAFNL